MNNLVKKFTQYHGDKNKDGGVGELLTNINHTIPIKSRTTFLKPPIFSFVNSITHTTHRV